MTLVFDTTALSRFLDEDQQLIKTVASNQFDRYIIPLATDAEVRYGFMYGSRELKNLDKYSSIIHELQFEIFCPDQDTSIKYAELATWARKHGISLSNNDIWIAATCSQLGGKLVAFDDDYKSLPQISLVDIG